MVLRDKLKSEKSKERYDRNFNSVETTFSQKELEEHDKEIRNKAIDEFAEKIIIMMPGHRQYIEQIAEQLKGVQNGRFD